TCSGSRASRRRADLRPRTDLTARLLQSRRWRFALSVLRWAQTLMAPNAQRPTPNAKRLRPVRYAPVILAGIPLRPARPRRTVVAIRLVRLRMHRLLRALADVAGRFVRSVRNLLGGLLYAVADVTGGLAHVVTRGLR